MSKRLSFDDWTLAELLNTPPEFTPLEDCILQLFEAVRRMRATTVVERVRLLSPRQGDVLFLTEPPPSPYVSYDEEMFALTERFQELGLTAVVLPHGTDLKIESSSEINLEKLKDLLQYVKAADWSSDAQRLADMVSELVDPGL